MEPKVGFFFFRTASGTEPVRDWLKTLPKKERMIIGEDMRVVQYSWPVGKPLVDHLGDGLWELRSRLDNRIARVIFCFQKHNIVALHGFIKKTQKTPKSELNTARKRKKQLEK